MRLARMTGRDEPPVNQLRANLERRLDSLQDSQFEKRFNHHGLKKTQASALDAATDPGSIGAGVNAASASSAESVTQANNPTDANSLGLDILSVISLFSFQPVPS
jgi:hypothetical protein